MLPEGGRVTDLCETCISSYVYFIYQITILCLESNKYNEKIMKLQKGL